MTGKPNSSRLRERIVVIALGVATILGDATYGSWGYERQLAVESFPVAGAEINPKSPISIQYRKRFEFLPGARLSLVAVSQDHVAEIRSSALTAYNWSLPKIQRTTYCFVPNFADYDKFLFAI